MDKYKKIEGEIIKGVSIVSFVGLTPAGSPIYKVRFDNGNMYERTLASIKKGLVDTKKKKDITKKKSVSKTRAKGKETFSQPNETEIFGYLDINDNILVLDQATLNTGYCVIKNKHINSYGRIRQKDKNHYIRIRELVQDIDILVKKNNIKGIIIEGIYLGYSPKTYRILCETIGAIALYCIMNDVSLLEISYSGWSSRLNLKGKRDSLKEQSLRKASEVIGKALSSDDTADSILIAYSFLLSRGIIREEVSW